MFLVILAAFAVSGWAAWQGLEPAQAPVFVFVVSGWVLSLCLHEFGHAFTAYRAGDRSVAGKGYLTLNPLVYSDAALSVVLPVLFVLLGGIGLPGGAVWVNRTAIRGRVRESLVSLVGPLSNLAFAALLIAPLRAAPGFFAEHPVLGAGIAYLAFLQVTATVLNLLPVPGLDGFGVAEPWLPRHWVRKVAPVSAFGILIVFALLWTPPINEAFFSAVFDLMEATGTPLDLLVRGDDLFRFWS